MISKTILLFTVILFAYGCSSSSGTWGWYVIDPSTKAGWTNIKFLVGGFYSTIALSLIAAVLSILLGLMVAIPGISDNKFIRATNRVYVEFVRAIPLLPMLFWVFYGLPVIFKSLGSRLYYFVFILPK